MNKVSYHMLSNGDSSYQRHEHYYNFIEEFES